MLLCTGKIVHELRRERERRGETATAVVALEQLYPFPRQELEAELARHPEARDLVWVQEEPANMGALFFVLPRIEHVAGRPVRSVKRSAQRQPGHRLGQGARDGAEDAAGAGVRERGVIRKGRRAGAAPDRRGNAGEKVTESSARCPEGRG